MPEDTSFPAFSLPPYELGKIANSVKIHREQGNEVIDLSNIRPNLPISNIAIDLLVESCLRKSNHSYSSSQGILKLRQTAKHWYKKRFEVELYEDEEIVITLGSKEGISHLLLAIAGVGDTILVPTPAYPILSAATAISGAGFIGVPLEEGNYNLDEKSNFFEKLNNIYNKTWPKPKALLINFPNNPTNTIATKCFYEKLVAFAKKNNVLVINDFAYGDLVFDKPGISLLSVKGAKDCCVETYSLSKGLGLAGWRIGFTVGNSNAIRALKKIKSYIDFGAFQAVQIAVSKFLSEHYDTAIESIENNKSIYQTRLELISNSLKSNNFEVAPVNSAVFSWAKLPKDFKGNSSEFANELLQKQNIAICPGSGFDKNSSSYIRVAAIADEPQIRLAMEKIKCLIS